MENRTVISVDINNFSEAVDGKDCVETAQYLSTFYKFVGDEVVQNLWRVVKTKGDSILITAPENITNESVTVFHNNISKSYQVTTRYRSCDVIDKEIKIGNYCCLDIFGSDIDQLFLGDDKTTTLQ